MSKKVHQKIYGPFAAGTNLHIQANPGVAQINYRGDISSSPGNDHKTWGDNELEAGVDYSLSQSAPYFLNITAIFLQKTPVTLTFTFTDGATTKVNTAMIDPESDNETHLIAADIFVN
jgi:hypothetical protein